MSLINKIFNILSYLKLHVFLDKYEKSYIKYNLSKWKKVKKTVSNGVILIDLFPFNPWIHFYSYLVNILSLRLKATPKYFYFDLYQGRQSKTSLFITKLKKIYYSFNVIEGISEYNFKYTEADFKKYNKAFRKLKFQKAILAKYKYKNILIGDLIYDTYLRINYVPTIDMRDKSLLKIFYRAHKILEEVENYFKNNNVKCLIPSHVCYINYGIISRIASKKKIPIIKVFSKQRGNSSLRLLKVNEKFVTEEQPYFDYKKTFLKFTKIKKKEAISIGKKLIQQRVSGQYDKNLPYMVRSSFSNNLKKINSKVTLKKKIFIFPHCYFDNPHRYRHMIFDDFYLQVKFFLDFSKNNNDYEWYYKPHPNELRSKLDIHKEILKDYPNVKYLQQDTSHKDVIKLNPACVITNHGTIGHEYAYYGVPVLNTGDNPHINYNFCLHLKSKNEILKTLNNLSYYKKKINFNKNNLYEFMYLNFEYFPNLNDERKYLKDSFFTFKKIKMNNTSKLFLKFTNQSKLSDHNIKKYINNFINNNFKQ